jgi:hypothetical protein
MENTKNFFRENSTYEWILSYYVKSDRINRIIRMFFCLHQFPEEIDETQSTFSGKKNFRVTIVSLFNFCTKKLWPPYADYSLPRRRRLSIFCFIRKQRIKNPINPVDPVKE